MSALYRVTAPAWQIALILFSVMIYPQPSASATEPPASPAMKRLFKAFLGDWAVRETFQRNEIFPQGGERKGVARFTVGTGGTSLVEDYHTNGSAGKLDFLMVIWWNAPAKSYQVFTCANGSDNAGRLRGTAHWERETFVNDYEEKVHGKEQKFQDRFSQMISGSFTLVAGIDRGGKAFQPLITTTYKRRIRPHA